MRIVPGLLHEVRKYGRFDANGCLNCGCCTIRCALSRDNASFPRRQMQYAVLGLKGPLLGSLEPWLCHDCGDCSSICPQQAEPRESMMTLRRYLIAQYDITRLGSKILLSKKAELMAISLVFLLVLILVVLYHLFYVKMSVADFTSIPMGQKHMFDTITYFTYSVYLIPMLLMILNSFRMFRFTMGAGRQEIPLRYYLSELKKLCVHMISHQNIRKCAQEVHIKRWIKHWLLAFACVLMSVITFFFLEWFQTDAVYPLYHPQRWLGYIATAILIFVPADILLGRIRKREEMHKFSEFSDLTLPVLLLLVAVTGIAVHIFRYTEWYLTSHFLYALHLAVTVPLLIVELPFGKWSHMIYRPLAIYFQSVKERALVETMSIKEAAA